MKTYRVYILASKRGGVLYVGMTGNMCKRIQEHKDGVVEGFTKTYRVKKLVYYETTNDANAAIQREKQLKRWKRERKIELIEGVNPDREDLSTDI